MAEHLKKFLETMVAKHHVTFDYDRVKGVRIHSAVFPVHISMREAESLINKVFDQYDLKNQLDKVFEEEMSKKMLPLMLGIIFKGKSIRIGWFKKKVDSAHSDGFGCLFYEQFILKSVFLNMRKRIDANTRKHITNMLTAKFSEINFQPQKLRLRQNVPCWINDTPINDLNQIDVEIDKILTSIQPLLEDIQRNENVVDIEDLLNED